MPQNTIEWIIVNEDEYSVTRLGRFLNGAIMQYFSKDLNGPLGNKIKLIKAEFIRDIDIKL